ncbi:MAG: type II toxin-antitoxin system VapC family toxin [Chloroflexota bacterium]
MPIVYFDTSALVRRYHPAEPGSSRVRALCRRTSGNVLTTAYLTPPEVASAFSRKLREGSISREQQRRGWRLFNRHRRDQYHVLALYDQICRRAEDLLFAHTLRAYDALQLATALQAARLLGALADFSFCTADRAQAVAATAEGLQVELIS